MAMAKAGGTSAQSQIRKHYYLDEYVVIAPKRNDRPFTISDKSKSGLSVKKGHMPIEGDPSVFEIKDDQGRWIVKVVENLYPALTIDNPKAYGRQEIVLETSAQGALFSSLPVAQITQVLSAYYARVQVLKKNPRLKHISIFKNHGFEAGGSLAHTHSQIIAIDFVPPQIEHERLVFAELYKRFGASPLGAALEWERQEELRIITSSPFVTAVSPYASRFPFEAWLIPHRHVASLLDLNPKELASFAAMLKQITSALDSRKISYNFYLHEGVTDHNHHFVIKIAPRPNVWAGFELDSGVIINPMPPEAAANWYRNFIRDHYAS